MCAINYSLRTALFRAYMCGVRKWWQARRTGSDAADERCAVIKKAPSIVRKLKEDCRHTVM